MFHLFVSSRSDRKGLGLSLARKKMISMGGLLTYHPMDIGTTFALLIPIIEVEA